MLFIADEIFGFTVIAWILLTCVIFHFCSICMETRPTVVYGSICNRGRGTLYWLIEVVLEEWWYNVFVFFLIPGYL